MLHKEVQKELSYKALKLVLAKLRFFLSYFQYVLTTYLEVLEKISYDVVGDAKIT